MKLNGRLTVTSRYGTLLIGGILGLAWFVYVCGPSRLDPTYLSWFMHGDGAQHVLGWLFFRNASWSWPLGAVPDFPYPVETTVGYTDSIPWLAVAFKVLSPVLPADFHYAGLWLGWCFFLQGWFGVKIVQALSPHPFVQILGGACFAFDPLLLVRAVHPALDSHWLILGLIWLHLQPWPVDRAPRRPLALALGFCLISAGIHPYLAIMVLALSLALLWKLHWVDRRLPISQMAVWAAIYSAAVLGTFTTFGYIGLGITWGRGAIGNYSADLLTLVNPGGTSRFFPPLPQDPGQEFGYVGSGVLVLSVIGLLVICSNPGIFRRCALKPWVPLGVCVALLALYALSPRVKLAGIPILTLDKFYRPFFTIAAIFHAAGRFIWSLHYLWITAVLAIVIVHAQVSRSTLYLILSAVIAIQVIELNVPFLGWGWQYQRKPPLTFEGGELERAAGLYKHIVLYPPEIWGGSLPGCEMPPFTMDILDRYVPLAYQAYRLKMTFNSGYFARINQTKSLQYCQELHEKIRAGEFEQDTIYFVNRQYWDRVSPHLPKIVCGRLGEYITCVSALRDDAFRDVLEQHRFE
jgi:Family of unknown function (DUF6311)